MDLSIITERAPGERRVPLTPTGVRTLVALGHDVHVQAGAGAGAGLPPRLFCGFLMFGHRPASGTPACATRRAAVSIPNTGFLEEANPQ